MNTDDMARILYHVLPAMQNDFSIRAQDDYTYFYVDPQQSYAQAFIAGIEKDLRRRIKWLMENHTDGLVPQ
ncbi:hypothetical protein SGGMMB4_04478 [Sodalis glossinidius str. 'morsitans']|uniref:Uncharacterized protein n=1 Tax=Sodalis glossinidius (strain morsitans) TaxID=343509 RepID=A0A193QG79_SODGM|nr:hypothetical protein [Sodalis glossinidius]CRL44172.1 hypothetical protein SGGMMB4_01117 [Sodalis glossinidius str. 'morsitans']CRL46131.1 hypothetical protein SGGMMB4_04478 [Sodalis glossinidius str. 'morsitans']